MKTFGHFNAPTPMPHMPRWVWFFETLLFVLLLAIVVLVVINMPRPAVEPLTQTVAMPANVITTQGYEQYRIGERESFVMPAATITGPEWELYRTGERNLSIAAPTLVTNEVWQLYRRQEFESYVAPATTITTPGYDLYREAERTLILPAIEPQALMQPQRQFVAEAMYIAAVMPQNRMFANEIYGSYHLDDMMGGEMVYEVPGVITPLPGNPQ